MIGARILPYARTPLNRLFLLLEELFCSDAVTFMPGPAPMSYRVPPLNGLRAFEAAGRHLSFKVAARELSVTPGADSQRVKHSGRSGCSLGRQSANPVAVGARNLR